MKNTIYIPNGLASPEFEILLSKAQELLDKKKDLDIITCSGKQNYNCSLNVFSQKSICLACNIRKNAGFGKLVGKFRLIETPKIFLQKNILRNLSKFNSIKNIRSYNFKKNDIGLASFSSYASYTRDVNLDGFFSKNVLRKILISTKNLADFFFEYFQENSVEEVYLFNGRQNHTRPFFRVANNNKLKVNLLEYSNVFYFNKFGVRNFENNLPNDIKFLPKQINSLWRSKNLKNNKNKKIDYVSNYFAYKKSGLVVNDKASYVLKQKKNLLPKEWNEKKRNIVFFTSSQDEYITLGGEYDKTIYKNQSEALKLIIKSFKNKKDFFLWIRIHPYLSNVKWDYNYEIFKYKNLFSNVRIIEGRSPISTYKLMACCEKVVSFNSSTVVEATYWNKPSILLGRQYFEKLNCSYIPRNHKQALNLIFSNNLKPKPKVAALKFAYYWVEGGIYQKYFSGNLLHGFRFKGNLIKKSFYFKTLFFSGKLIQKYFYNFFNYYLRKYKN